MTLLGVQQRFREIGRIRTGALRVGKNGRAYPTSLKTFRFTSQDRAAIESVAAAYGGIATEWEEGHGWQVTTESDRVNIMLPPKGGSEQYSLNYELWTGGGLQRRCDGRDAIVGGEESQCVCDPDARECAPTLRVSLILPDLPGLGTWRLESKGYNAAAELPGSLNLLALYSDRGQPVRAVLRLEQRSAKRDGQTHNFVVPTIDIPYSMNALMDRALSAPPAVKMLAVIDEPPDGEADAEGPDEREASEEAAPATTPALSADQIAARYEWAERFGFDHATVDAAATAAVNATVAVMDDATWRAFAILVKTHAIAPVTAQDGPGVAEAVSEPPEAITVWSEPQDEPDPLASRIARAEKRAKGEKP